MIIKRTVLFILLTLITVSLFSQKFFEINKIKDTSVYEADSIMCYFNEIDTEHVEIKIINNSPNTYYIFSTYLNFNYISNTYLHRIDTSNKRYKLSFLPLIPYLTCTECEAANYIDGENDENILSQTRNKIKFEELKAHHVFVFNLDIQDILSQYVVEDFNVRKIENYSKNSLIQSKQFFDDFEYYHVLIEFALYKSIKEVKEYKNVEFFQNTPVNKSLKEYIKLSCYLNK